MYCSTGTFITTDTSAYSNLSSSAKKLNYFTTVFRPTMSPSLGRWRYVELCLPLAECFQRFVLHHLAGHPVPFGPRSHYLTKNKEGHDILSIVYYRHKSWIKGAFTLKKIIPILKRFRGSFLSRTFFFIVPLMLSFRRCKFLTFIH